MEIVATILLALAAVATAWSSYQATRWNGEQAKAAGRVNALRIEAARAQGLARARPRSTSRCSSSGSTPTPTTTTLEDSTPTGSAPSSDPPSTPGWPPTRSPTPTPRRPRSPWTNTSSPHRRGRAARRRGRGPAAKIRVDIQRSANYVLAVVLFAVALFFAGMSTKLRGTARMALLLTVASCSSGRGVDPHVPDQPLRVARASRPTPDQIKPSRRPASTASARDAHASLRYTLRTWDLSVLSDTYSAAAISG